MTTYTVEAIGSGNVETKTATNYREARRAANSLRNGYYSKVQIIKGEDIAYDHAGYPTNITDKWACDGSRRWTRVNP